MTRESCLLTPATTAFQVIRPATGGLPAATRLGPNSLRPYNPRRLEREVGKGVPMRSIAVINQKGGVGKTTTAVNLSAALAATGQRVCLVDLDPQAHATLHLGLEPGRDDKSV